MNTSRAGSNMPCSRIQRRRARATSARSCSAARRLFFEADLVPLERSARLHCGCRRSVACASPRRFHLASNPIAGQSEPTESPRAASSGEMLPPVGLAATLPVSCQRCSHLIAELALTSNQSAASRRDAPAITASSTRSAGPQNRVSASIPSIESMPLHSLIFAQLRIPIQLSWDML